MRNTQYVVHRWPCIGYDNIPCPKNILLDDIISTRKKRCESCKSEHNKIRLRTAYENRIREARKDKFLEGNV